MIKFNVNKLLHALIFPTNDLFIPFVYFPVHFFWFIGQFFFIVERLALYCMSCLMPSGMHWAIHFFLQSFYYQLFLLCIYLFKLQIFSYEFFIYLFLREALLLHMPKRDVYGYMMVHAECSSATVVVVSLNNYKPLL